jgi:hypothetical protein
MVMDKIWLTGLFTVLNKLWLQGILILLMVFSFPIYPEASMILKHYCFGNGDTLHLPSDYLRKSPVILKNLKQMKIGQTRIIRFKQPEDWRLSYALNGFSLTKKSDKVIVKQWIEFDKKGGIHTDLNLYLFKIRIKDNIVHVFDCTPFWAYSEFSLVPQD